MVRLQLRLTTSPGHLRETVQALQMLRFCARLDRRCVQDHLYCEVDDPTALCYIEDWCSAEDLDTEIRSDRFSRLLALMETAVEPPELEFGFVSETRGLDYVAEVRAGRTPAR